MHVARASSLVFGQSVARSLIPKPTGVRFNSTSGTEKKAQDALASAQKVAGQTWEKVVKFLGPAGDKLGQMLGRYKDPILYNLAVTREVMKRIYINEALQPPSLSQFSSAYRHLWSNATQIAYWRNAVQSGQITQVGVYGLQAYGLFKIGEIFGRRHLVGYPVH